MKKNSVFLIGGLCLIIGVIIGLFISNYISSSADFWGMKTGANPYSVQKCIVKTTTDPITGEIEPQGDCITPVP